MITTGPITPSEDYAFFVEQGVPSLYMSLGGADPRSMPRAEVPACCCLPITRHTFAPDVDPALQTGIKAEVAVLRDLLNGASR